MTKSLAAIIPARLDDAIIPGKNLLPFGSSTLLEYKIETLMNVPLIDTIIVSSDSDIYLDVASRLGAVVDKRPSIHSSTTSDFSDFVEYIASNCSCDHILWAPVTAPLVTSFDFSSAITTYYEQLDSPCDSLITVDSIQRYLLDDNGPLNFRFHPSNRSSNRLPTLYRYINAITIAPRSSMLNWRYNWGPNPYKFLLPAIKALEICSMLDYEMVLAVYNSSCAK
jgi:CMP-N-acetylneuraminic acid synthetase